jgi:mono/diheme cytochrome c family protein
MNRALLLLLALAACGGGKRAEPPSSPPTLDARAAHGQIVFMHTCNPCHPQGEAGLGGALTTKPLPGGMIKAKVRGSLPGDMPKFSSRDISDADLDDLVAYVVLIRSRSGRRSE